MLKNNSIIFRYIISGGTAAFVDIVLLYIFTDILHVWYFISAILAFIVAVIVNFILQKYWTFQKNFIDAKQEVAQSIGFFIVSAINLVINTVLMYISVDLLKFWYIGSQIVISGIIAWESFLMYRVIFSDKE